MSSPGCGSRHPWALQVCLAGQSRPAQQVWYRPPTRRKPARRALPATQDDVLSPTNTRTDQPMSSSGMWSVATISICPFACQENVSPLECSGFWELTLSSLRADCLKHVKFSAIKVMRAMSRNVQWFSTAKVSPPGQGRHLRSPQSLRDRQPWGPVRVLLEYLCCVQYC